MEYMQKFEVIRMIERDGRCYVSMDCVEGTLLIYRVQKGEILEKNQVLDWIRQLAVQLELYHRCGSGQCYRFLNPYSVLITREEQILLLDLEASSNEFVIRNMQKRAMRSHFAMPVSAFRDQKDSRLATDLYSLGRTVQFLLACTEIYPSFSQFEEYRVSKFVQKCLGTNSKRKYENLQEIQKDIPKRKKRSTGERRRLFICGILLAAGLLALLSARIGRQRGENVVTMVQEGEAENSASPDVQKETELTETESLETEEINEIGKMAGSEIEEETAGAMEEQTMESELGNEAEKSAAMEIVKGDGAEAAGIEELREAFLENTKEGNEKVIRDGELLKSELLYYLAMSYDREGQIEEAIEAYHLLCQSQCSDEILEQAFYRKASLEQASQQIAQASETCGKGLELFPESEELNVKLQELEEEEADAEESQGQEEMPQN